MVAQGHRGLEWSHPCGAGHEDRLEIEGPQDHLAICVLDESGGVA